MEKDSSRRSEDALVTSSSPTVLHTYPDRYEQTEYKVEVNPVLFRLRGHSIVKDD